MKIQRIESVTLSSSWVFARAPSWERGCTWVNVYARGCVGTRRDLCMLLFISFHFQWFSSFLLFLLGNRSHVFHGYGFVGKPVSVLGVYVFNIHKGCHAVCMSFGSEIFFIHLLLLGALHVTLCISSPRCRRCSLGHLHHVWLVCSQTPRWLPVTTANVTIPLAFSTRCRSSSHDNLIIISL